jgi:hypothetical protein
MFNVGSWEDIMQVAVGEVHTVGLKTDGTVEAVGSNGNGQLNVGSWEDIVQVAAGYLHTVGLKTDGTVEAVGWNDNGQLNVGSWEDIVQVAAGRSHTVGLKSDGTVEAVGSNGDGQCDVSDWNLIISKPVSIDIIPKTCPSETPIKGGAVEVVIHGTVDLDVNDIDIASVRLKGVAPTRSSLKDKSTPYIPAYECDCTTDGKDGEIDLSLKFNKKEIISALGGVTVDIPYPLTLTGELIDRTPIEGEDCITFVKKGGKKD